MTSARVVAEPLAASAQRQRARRELALAVVLSVLGGALALFAASRQWWVEQAARPAPLPPVRHIITGKEVAPWASAMGLVALAGAAALVATAKRGRLLVGLIVTGAGLAAALAGIVGLIAEPEAGVQRLDLALFWPVSLAAAGALITSTGVLTVLRFRRWQTNQAVMSAQYEAPGTPLRTRSLATGSHSISSDPTVLWDSLDRGIDPTQPPPDRHDGDSS
ncbi:MAG: Trp biosynthesis protein [Acidimicrobiales bacterium]|nr:MAG: Trp biosynthesis protein [Acidimicrobiales bacterium]